MPIKPIFLFLALITTPLLALAPPALAGPSQIYTGTFSDDALQGYDAVAYFKQGKPVKGSKAYATEYQGAEWKFASQDNLKTFLANPKKYAPQYGGHCAWAAAQGNTAKSDARNWSIVDGKLYLNYNDAVQSKWESDRAALISKADANWPNI